MPLPASSAPDEDGVVTSLHADGSLAARGPYVDGEMHGYWEWFRLDGTLKRSGTLDRGQPRGEWVTYDAHGAPYKVTDRG
jgi:antitoxin component YwqK of YwqJK toxin-antitoxin module